jgi:hypothetical protein
MRKLLSLLFIGALASFYACVGPVGPPGVPGPQGPQGQPGADGLIGEAFEVDVNFTAANNYQAVFDFQPPIFESDVVLIYIQWETANGNTFGGPCLRPYFFEEGTLIYNYDFSKV